MPAEWNWTLNGLFLADLRKEHRPVSDEVAAEIVQHS